MKKARFKTVTIKTKIPADHPYGVGCETCGEDCGKKWMYNVNIGLHNEGQVLFTEEMYYFMLDALNAKKIMAFGTLEELDSALSHAVPVCDKCLKNTPGMPSVII